MDIATWVTIIIVWWFIGATTCSYLDTVHYGGRLSTWAKQMPVVPAPLGVVIVSFLFPVVIVFHILYGRKS